MWIILLPTIFIVLVCIKLLLNYTYWSRKGVAQFQPWPFFGNAGPSIFGLLSFTDVMQNLYTSASDKRYCGMYNFLRPVLLLKCPDLIKSLTVREFSTFPEHRLILPSEADSLYLDNILNMPVGKKWRDCRSLLTSCITTSKLKVLFDSMLHCAVNCMLHLEKHEGLTGVNMLDAFSRYSNDISYNTTFGVMCNSFENPANEFYLMGKTAGSNVPWRSLTTYLNSINPILVKIFQPRKALSSVERFYRTNGMKYIRQAEINGNDHFSVISLLTKERKRGSQVLLTDEDIINQAFIFYLGGLASPIITLCYTIYELAFNPDIQKRLQVEIDNTSDLSYSSLLEMKYLDMVISETLRKWPPETVTDRRSIKPFTIEPVTPRERHVHLEVGTEIWISIYSLHRDPTYYPEPEKFDPERFNSTNRSKLNHLAYLPFGAGPRQCIAPRFALLVIKLMIYHILGKYDVVPTKRTQTSLVFDPYNVVGVPKGEFWFEVRPRKRK